MVIYENKKIAYFLPNKDKIPKLSRSKIIYQITCPGCSNSYIGKTKRCLKSRLLEHSDPTKSAVGHHFYNCENVRHIVDMHHLFDRLNDKTTDSDDVSIFISNLIINNSRIVHSPNSRTSNFLLFLEALYIKHKSPALNTGLKASKELMLFP